MFAVLLLSAERPRTCVTVFTLSGTRKQVLGLSFCCVSANVNWQAALFLSGGKILLLRHFRFLRLDLGLQHVPVCFVMSATELPHQSPSVARSLIICRPQELRVFMTRIRESRCSGIRAITAVSPLMFSHATVTSPLTGS